MCHTNIKPKFKWKCMCNLRRMWKECSFWICIQILNHRYLNSNIEINLHKILLFCTKFYHHINSVIYLCSVKIYASINFVKFLWNVAEFLHWHTWHPFTAQRLKTPAHKLQPRNDIVPVSHMGAVVTGLKATLK